MRQLSLLIVVGATACGGPPIQIDFDLYASNELDAGGAVCFYDTVPQSGSLYKPSGFLELDPAINPNPEYELGLQVENTLGTVSGSAANDFHVERAEVTFIDIEGELEAVPNASVLVSGDIRPSGVDVLPLPAVPVSVAAIWVEAFKENILATENVVLQIQLFGVLGSGDPTTSDVFTFPLKLCWDCGGISPTATSGTATCATGTIPTPSGVGPCCAGQDFTDVCAACGDVGQPCCASNSCNSTGLVCGSSSADACNYAIEGTCLENQ